MKELTQHDIQHISGAGFVLAAVALPFSILAGIGGAGMGATSGLLGAFVQKKGVIDCIKTSAATAAMGAQIGIILETNAYNW